MSKNSLNEKPLQLNIYVLICQEITAMCCTTGVQLPATTGISLFATCRPDLGHEQPSYPNSFADDKANRKTKQIQKLRELRQEEKKSVASRGASSLGAEGGLSPTQIS
jgi:hypothetical protein